MDLFNQGLPDLPLHIIRDFEELCYHAVYQQVFLRTDFLEDTRGSLSVARKIQVAGKTTPSIIPSNKDHADAAHPSGANCNEARRA